MGSKKELKFGGTGTVALVRLRRETGALEGNCKTRWSG